MLKQVPNLKTFIICIRQMQINDESRNTFTTINFSRASGVCAHTEKQIVKCYMIPCTSQISGQKWPQFAYMSYNRIVVLQEKREAFHQFFFSVCMWYYSEEYKENVYEANKKGCWNMKMQCHANKITTKMVGMWSSLMSSCQLKSTKYFKNWTKKSLFISIIRMYSAGIASFFVCLLKGSRSELKCG